MNKYTLLEEKFIDEIQSNVKIYKHNKTNARICTLENDDTNKVFSIAFRTPPINSTGLTHILEHSVLCGSKKYPVKDPFVELLKSSMNTFLNAFTFPDKTMYPCASQNDKDFKNLMSVYMDAVFYPQIYQHEEIFMQEGWHYHILNEEDDITYNGVVYNEMKGAFSNPEQVLVRSIMHSLYPDTPYSYESGGDPKYIIDLSYEEFKDFHSKFYHPSNSYIFIYGDCDMEERLDWLDKEYLNDFEAINFNTEINYQKPFDKPLYNEFYYPISADEALDNKTFLSYNLAFETTLNPKLNIAISILVQALLENPGAPLKQALIDANLGQDVNTFYEDGILQPLFSIMIYNSNKDLEDKFINIVDNKLIELSNSLDKDMILSLINFYEFKAREQMFSSRMPKGLEIQMTMLNSWLYDDSQALMKLEVLKYFEELKLDLENGYFEDIIKKYFINNTHKSFVKLIPSYDCMNSDSEEIKNKLAEYKKSLSNEELKALIKKNNDLKIYQSTPSDIEAINTLPKLEISDIKIEPQNFNLEIIEREYKVLFSQYHTNDISYINYYFDISKLNENDLLYLSLYCDLFLHLSTKNRSYKDINQFLLRTTGGLNLGVIPYDTFDNESKLLLKLSFSSLADNVNSVNELIIEMINSLDFNDEKRLFERLSEIKTMKEMSASNIGHVLALNRALSYFDESSKNSDLISGISYIDFIMNIFNNFSSLKDDIINNLNNIKYMLAKDNFTFGFCGMKNQLEEAYLSVDSFYQALFDKSNFKTFNYVRNILNEGFKTQYNVNFVSKAFKFNDKYDGRLLVLENALSLDYLWNQVRVLGGAYGCMLRINRNGTIAFTSYRDPNIKSTLDVYDNVISFINNLSPTDDELLKYKIGAMGKLESVMHVSAKANQAFMWYFNKIDYEYRKEIRRSVVSTTLEDLKDLVKYFTPTDDSSICVIGNSKLVDDNKNLFKNIRNLIK